MSAVDAGALPDSAAAAPDGQAPITPPDSDAGAMRARDVPSIGTGSDPKASPVSSDHRDAGSDAAAPGMTNQPRPAPDAGASSPTSPADPTAPDMTAPVSMSVDPECTRDALRAKANAYLQAMVMGAPGSLRLHSAVRYTENGQNQQLGAGVWLRAPEVDFARHVLDEARCGSVTQAVLSSRTGPIVFGVRLLYRDGELLEVEAHVVPAALTRIDVSMIVPIGPDRFVEPVPEAQRMSRQQLEAYAERYFDAAVSGGEVPPSEPTCRRRQNGVPLGDGLCTGAPGTMRFEQRRYPVVDEVAGIITAAVLYDSHVGFYLFKIAGDAVQSIEVIGGASTQSSGW